MKLKEMPIDYIVSVHVNNMAIYLRQDPSFLHKKWCEYKEGKSIYSIYILKRMFDNLVETYGLESTEYAMNLFKKAA